MNQEAARTREPGRIKRHNARLLWIYAINATLLICHEIDSASWREWELFQIPGGAPVFVALHLVVVPLILVGLIQIVRQTPAARWTSLVIGGLGTLGSLLHSAFLLSGDSRFASTFSAALILGFGISSALLLAVVLSSWRSASPP